MYHYIICIIKILHIFLPSQSEITTAQTVNSEHQRQTYPKNNFHSIVFGNTTAEETDRPIRTSNPIDYQLQSPITYNVCKSVRYKEIKIKFFWGKILIIKHSVYSKILNVGIITFTFFVEKLNLVNFPISECLTNKNLLKIRVCLF